MSVHELRVGSIKYSERVFFQSPIRHDEYYNCTYIGEALGEVGDLGVGVVVGPEEVVVDERHSRGGPTPWPRESQCAAQPFNKDLQVQHLL